ncbi:hypothetical protein IWW51_001055 [Coemansia sp. RSA 2702]|nr:hypothetical protein IWW51_001055 [Coemansia sp. RSA 2702]
MHARRSGDIAVHGRSAAAAAGPRSSVAAPQRAGAGADVFSPRLQGEPIEYYFYPHSAVPVFCPTAAQFADFEALVSAVEPLAQRGGVCKIVPPRQWRAELERRNGRGVFAEEQFPIMKPIVQHFNGSGGTFHQYNVEFHRKLKLAQFFHMSQDASHRRPEVKVPSAEDAEGGGSDADDADDVPRVVQSDTAGVAVDYATGRVRLTSAAADALQRGVRSDAQRARFEPAVAQYRPQPDAAGEPACADHTGARQPRRFARDGRALFVTEREYAENEELERMYWKNLLFQPPMYGADVLGTLFPPEREFPTWNIRSLPGLLRQIGQRMPGVNDPYLYLGMWKATFAWHVEDMDLYSINYIHFGEPKSWYSIPIDAHSRFEMSMQNVFANDHKQCAQFLRHKAFLLSPRFLAAQGIPFNRVVQRAGEIMLTFPHGYHAGFNHGFNCAESVNFALDSWLDVAWSSKHCECVKDSVTIDLMEWFGDARRQRLQEQKPQGAGPPAQRPRRHAAAAAAIASKPAGTTARDVKRRSSSSAAPVSPQKKRAVERPADDVGDDDVASAPCDPTRRFASLHTPVGTCGACLQPISAADMADEGAVVECLQCGLTVHPQCSALQCDDGNYRCANCEMDTDQLSCALCAYQNGLLLPISSPAGSAPLEFAHFLCATFISETYFESSPSAERIGTRSRTAARSSAVMRTSAKVCGVGEIARARFQAKCMYCVDDGCVGPVVQCAHPRCARRFHPMCAAVRDLSRLDWSEYKVYCPTHTSA